MDVYSSKERRQIKMKVTLETVIGDIVDCDENTADIFLESGMHCITCPATQYESLEMACYVHMLDVDEVVDCVNAFLEDNVTV